MITDTVLTKTQAAAQVLISRELLQDAEVEITTQLATDQLVMTLRKFLWEDKLISDPIPVSFTYFASPWQEYKCNFIADWFLKRWPVKYKTETKTITFERKHLFPDFNKRYPNELGQVVVHELVREW